MVTRALLALVLGACVGDGRPIIIAHRAQGVGPDGENLPANVPLVFAAGFGAEVDVRGDGARPFELGHLAPNGHDLHEVFAAVAAAWRPDFAGRVLVIDVSDDTGDAVSNGLIDAIYADVAGTELEALQLIVESSNDETLSRMVALQSRRAPALPIRFAQTYWHAPEYTTAAWVDLVATSVTELGEFAHPKPLLLFNVETRNAYRDALTSHSEVFAVITDHPRRAAAW